jgi:hypothetical protein
MYPIYKSKTPLKRKIALMIVFALGALWVSNTVVQQRRSQFETDLEPFKCRRYEHYPYADSQLFVHQSRHYL